MTELWPHCKKANQTLILAKYLKLQFKCAIGKPALIAKIFGIRDLYICPQYICQVGFSNLKKFKSRGGCNTLGVVGLGKIWQGVGGCGRV